MASLLMFFLHRATLQLGFDKMVCDFKGPYPPDGQGNLGSIFFRVRLRPKRLNSPLQLMQGGADLPPRRIPRPLGPESSEASRGRKRRNSH